MFFYNLRDIIIDKSSLETKFIFSFEDKLNNGNIVLKCTAYLILTIILLLFIYSLWYTNSKNISVDIFLRSSIFVLATFFSFLIITSIFAHITQRLSIDIHGLELTMESSFYILFYKHSTTRTFSLNNTRNFSIKSRYEKFYASQIYVIVFNKHENMYEECRIPIFCCRRRNLSIFIEEMGMHIDFNASDSIQIYDVYPE
jgi:hypothetical protein